MFYFTETALKKCVRCKNKGLKFKLIPVPEMFEIPIVKDMMQNKFKKGNITFACHV